MTRPDDIASDVWDEAREVVFDIDCDWTLDGRRRGDFEEQQATILVARAIMAGMEKQRKADAEICAAEMLAAKANGALQEAMGAHWCAVSIRKGGHQ